MKGRSAHRDRIDRFLTAVARQGVTTTSAGAVAVTVFGSALDTPEHAADLDLWVTGHNASVATFRYRVVQLAEVIGIPVDVHTAATLPAWLALAVQWEASHGLALIGEMPQRPAMTAHEVGTIYRVAALARAKCALDRSDLLARLGLSSAAEYAEYAARWILRSQLTAGGRWRAVRPLTGDTLCRALYSVALEIPDTVALYGWSSQSTVRELQTLYASLCGGTLSVAKIPSAAPIKFLARQARLTDDEHSGGQG